MYSYELYAGRCTAHAHLHFLHYCPLNPQYTYAATIKSSSGQAAGPFAMGLGWPPPVLSRSNDRRTGLGPAPGPCQGREVAARPTDPGSCQRALNARRQKRQPERGYTLRTTAAGHGLAHGTTAEWGPLTGRRHPSAHIQNCSCRLFVTCILST